MNTERAGVQSCLVGRLYGSFSEPCMCQGRIVPNQGSHSKVSALNSVSLGRAFKLKVAAALLVEEGNHFTFCMVVTEV